MILNDSVIIKELSVTYNDEAMPVKSWSNLVTIKADVQPIGGEIAHMEYGISESGISHRIFCRPNSNLKVGNRIEYNSTDYEIRHIAPFKNHYEVLLKTLS